MQSKLLKRNGSIKICLYKEDRSVIGIDIIDDGRGIPKHEQEFIFEPFYRGENKKLRLEA